MSFQFSARMTPPLDQVATVSDVLTPLPSSGRIVLSDPRDFLEWRRGGGTTVEVTDIQVGSDRRRGRGRDLMSRLVGLVRADAPECRRLVYAVTRATNEIAQAFYEALDFRVVGVLRRFYQDEGGGGVDAVVYGYDLFDRARRPL